VRFKVDENLPVEVADLLRKAGHDAATVVEQGRGGAVDPDLASLIRAEGRTLVTLDVGFSNIRAFRPSDYPGLVVLRPTKSRQGRGDRVGSALSSEAQARAARGAPVGGSRRPSENPELKHRAEGATTYRDRQTWSWPAARSSS